MEECAVSTETARLNAIINCQIVKKKNTRTYGQTFFIIKSPYAHQGCIYFNQKYTQDFVIYYIYIFSVLIYFEM